MKTKYHPFLSMVILVAAQWAAGQTIDKLALSTRCVGAPPVRQTINSTAQWMENPLEQKLEIAVTNFCADADASMEIDIADRQLIFNGAGRDSNGDLIPTNYAPVEVDVFLRHTYSMNITCPNSGQQDNSGTAQINLFIQPPNELIITNKTKQIPPYSVLVNGFGATTNTVMLSHPSGGDLSTNYSFVEVLKSKFCHYGVGDGCDDATKAPGQGAWLTLGPGCTRETNRISLSWNVSLGRTFDGLAAGQLAFRQTSLTWNSYTPFALYYNGSMTNLCAEMPLGTADQPFVPTNLYASVILVTTNIPWLTTNSTGDVCTNYDDLLRQVKSCQTFVDILTPDTNQTVLNFYFPSQVGTNQNEIGLYTNITGSPFVSWTIKNPDPGTTNNLLIIEDRSGNVSTQSLVKTTSNNSVTWTLTQGSGAETRLETRKVSFTGGPPSTDRVELDTIKYANSDTPAYQCEETYHFYPWGSELVETSVSNRPSNLVTTYEYYTNTDGSNPGNPYGAGYGKVKQIVYPDGYWEKRVYWGYVDIPVNAASGQYGYEGYVALQVLHPYFNGSDGGTASPDNADYSNCSDDLYLSEALDGMLASWGGLTGAGGYSILTFDHGLLSGGEACYTWDGSLDDGPVHLSLSGNNFVGDDDFIGQTSDYADGAPVGVAGHPDYVYTTGWTKEYYYDHGVFNPDENTFSIDPTNHLYTYGAITNLNSDHRQTELDLMGDGEFRSGLAQAEVCDAYYTIEDHNDGAWMAPNVTRKCTRIYHGGNILQTEGYVYTGPGSGEHGDVCENPQWALIAKVRYYVDSLGHPTNVVRIDPSTQTRTLYTADYRGNNDYDGELLLSETDENGQKRSYTYDSLQRVKTMTVKGYGTMRDRVTTYTYDADGQVTSQTITVTGGSLSTSESWDYDLAGRVTNHVDQSGIATQTSYSADNLSQTNTLPGGITTIQTKYLDRQPESLQGNGCVSQFCTHQTKAVTQEEPLWEQGWGVVCCREQLTHLGHQNSSRWTGQGPDFWGNSDAWKESPTGENLTNTVWLFREYYGNTVWFDFASPGYPSTEYLQDFYGVCYTNCNGFTGDALYSWADADNGYGRVNYSGRYVTEINGALYQVTTNLTYLTDGNSGQSTMTSIHLEQLNGFTGNESARSIDYDADSNKTTTTTYIDRNDDMASIAISEPNTSSLSATNVYQNSLLIASSTLSVANPTRYFYDDLGRTNQIQSPLGFSAYMTYDPNTGWLTSSTDLAGNPTTYSYYGTNEANAGKLKCQTNANGKKTYYSYTKAGQLYRTWGDVPYPAEYHYSEYGDLTNLITFRGGTGWTGSTWPTDHGDGDNTYWIYDGASGALLQKIDAQGKAVTYTYYPESGRLFTRSWQRTVGGVPVTVTNCYDTTFTYTPPYTDDHSGFGDLVEQDYSDGTPTVKFNNYNRAGQPRQIVDATGTNDLVYDFANRLVSATGEAGGLYAGITVSNHFDWRYGRDKLIVTVLSSTLEDDFGYDDYGRLGSVSSDNCSATYGYLPDSDLLQTTTFQNGGNAVMTTTRSWQYGFRLGSIANTTNGAAVTSHSYIYDALNRRTQATLEDGSYWRYDYNDRNELTGAKRYWPDLSLVSGQQYGYAYDNIGNRQSATFGGNADGGNLQTISYTANELNQYTTILTPGEKEILGLSSASDPVTVNGGLADRKGEYFHREISVDNTNQPVWEGVTSSSGYKTASGGTVFPAHNQTLAYDVDGNLIFDGIWTYQWDGENRLKSMTMTNAISGIADSNILQLQFSYDYMGRRVSKIVSAWNGSAFIPQFTNLFVYDGWNLIAIINPDSSVTHSFMWGQDLSGTMDQAGGIGGLVMASIFGANAFPAYDGNGNITAFVTVANGSTAARYEYSPYGELVRETGPLARQNPFRFSTKFWDEESGLICYPSRYYSPILGRWLGRDPLEEKGGINLLAFVLNNPVLAYDALGKDDDLADEEAALGLGEYAEGGAADEALGILGRVRQVVREFDEVQEMTETLMESSSGDNTDLLIDLLSKGDETMSEGFGDLTSGYGRTGVEQFEKHHIFPQQFAKDFSRAGIKIDQWLARLQKVDHIGVHQGGWNADWDAFLHTGGGKSGSEMFEFAMEMMQKYGCNASTLY